MKRLPIMPAVVASLAFSSVATTPVRAGGGDVAAGVIGDLAAGTIISGSRWTALLRSAAGNMSRQPAIGRVESRYGMDTRVCGHIRPSEFASKSLCPQPLRPRFEDTNRFRELCGPQ